MLAFIARNHPDTDSAGHKAKTDMDTIMAAGGMHNIGVRPTRLRNKAAAFIAGLAGALRAMASMRRGDVVVLQYPLKKYYSAICRVARLRGAATVTLVHDLGCFRRGRITPEREVARLALTDVIIPLTGAMRSWLADRGLTALSEPLGLWDYLSPAPTPRRSYDPAATAIVYAGALARRKNSFLYSWAPAVSVNLYGRGFRAGEASSASISYRGFMPADELITSAEGMFGLVWDGDSADSCSGPFGSYLAVNAPHKASLYLRCGLPLLVWRGAAIAPTVESLGIGIAIDSLADIPSVIASMTPERYAVLTDAVTSTASLMESGHFFNSALRSALSLLPQSFKP